MKGLIKLCTAGSVDDGKSTLIGRILMDTQNLNDTHKKDILSDQDVLNLAHVTDGLKEEREKGITIDVAYRYFSTDMNRYILADSPGHFEYTRNMITAASGVDVMVLIIDAKNGIVEQTKRHTYIASFLGIKNLIICINKMDTVAYSAEIFDFIRDQYTALTNSLSFDTIDFIPISALLGDNVVQRSDTMSWYTGSTLIHTLDTLNLKTFNKEVLRLSISHTSSDESNQGILYANLLSGSLSVEDLLRDHSGRYNMNIATIYHGLKEVNEVSSPASISLKVNNAHELPTKKLYSSISSTPPLSSTELSIKICWLDNERMMQRSFLVKHATGIYKATVSSVNYIVDINTYDTIPYVDNLNTNDIVSVTILLEESMDHDLYETNRRTGALIIIDPRTKNTVAAGIIY